MTPLWTRILATLQGLLVLAISVLIWADPVRLFDLAGYSVQARLPIALLATAGVATSLPLIYAALGTSPARLAFAAAPLALFYSIAPVFFGLNIGAFDPAYHGLGILPTTIMAAWVLALAMPMLFVWLSARSAMVNAE